MSTTDRRTNFRPVTVDNSDALADTVNPHSLLDQDIAGRYAVKAHIGGGGMADVFLAFDQQLGIDVAIKVLRPGLASDDLRARMVQEAQAAAQISHPNLVRVFGVGTFGNTAFIIMELIRGPNLDQYLHEYPHQRLPWQQALELLLPAVAALHEVHERGFLHRDIKPGNLLISHKAGHPPAAVVIDLGLAKPNQALRAVDGPATTETGRLLCTPGYASPEQAAGVALDRRSDIYSLAVTLYRVLAGRLPFADARGQPPLVVLAKHMYNQPTLLTTAAPDAEIPPAIAEVIESALAKHPNDRPPTMLAFAAALRAAAARCTAVPVEQALPPAPKLPRWSVLALGFALGSASFAVIIPRPVAPAPLVLAAAAPGHDSPQSSDDPPVSADDPPASAVHSPAADPTPMVPPQEHTLSDADIATTPTPQDHRPIGLDKWHQELDRFTPDVQQCFDKLGTIEKNLRVAVTITTTGQISARIRGSANTPLGRCLAQLFAAQRVPAPKAPIRLTHVFSVEPSEPR